MPIARFQLPDGRIARFEVPEGTSPEQAQVMMQKHFAGEKPKEGSPVRDTVRAGLQGLSMGFSDEAGAGIAAGAAKLAGADEPIGDIYRGMKGQIAEEQKQFTKEHPVLSTTAEIAGAAIPAVLTAGASTTPQTLMQAAKTGAKIGGIQGAAYGAGTADTGETITESAINTAKGAGKGGTLGAVAGGTLSPAVIAAGRLTKGIVSSIANSFGKGDEKKAVAIIRKVAEDAGISAEDAAEQLHNLGPKATLADVDENFLIKAKNAVNQYGPQKQAFRELVTDRQLGEHADVLKVLSKQSGGFTGDDVHTALQQTGVERSKAASPLYDVALREKGLIPENDTYAKLQATPVFKRAIAKAGSYADNDMDRVVATSDQSGGLVSSKLEAGKLTEAEKLHYAKIALYDMETAKRKAGMNKAADDIANVRRKTIEVLDQIPEYKQARQIWSSSKEAEEAAKVGQDIFKLNPEEFKQAVAGMNEHDIQMAKMGVMNAATDKAGATKDARSIAGMLTDTENQRKKIKALFGGEDELNELVKNAKKWDTFRKTKNVLTSGSITAESMTTSAQDAVTDIIANPKAAITNKMIEALKGSRMSPETAQEVGKILSKQGWTRDEITKIIGKPSKSLSSLAARTTPSAPLVGAEKLNDLMRQQ